MMEFIKPCLIPECASSGQWAGLALHDVSEKVNTLIAHENTRIARDQAEQIKEEKRATTIAGIGAFVLIAALSLFIWYLDIHYTWVGWVRT